MRILIVLCFFCLMSETAFAVDLFAQKTAKGNVVAVASMNKAAVNKPLTLDKLTRITATTPFNALNNYYYWGYRNDINKMLSLYTKKDGSWQRLNDKANRGKSPFVQFSKLAGVKVKEKYLWGDYQIYKVVWQTEVKEYNWLDTIYCNITSCQYSDMLLRFGELENGVTGAINRAQDKLQVSKTGMQNFAFFPMGLNHNPLTFYYNLESRAVTDRAIWPIASKAVARDYSLISKYIASVRSAVLETPEQHNRLGTAYWQSPGKDVDLYIPIYTYQGPRVKIQGYSLAAFQQKLQTFDTISVIAQIPTVGGRLVVCQGLLSDGSKQLFVVPESNQGKLYVPQLDDMVWIFVNTNEFASHLNGLVNL
ncbi:MAG: hypothetical protein ACI8WB_000901 [Phenylobacterium sp.]|jgi:hypothetical protein